jgi:hypothetical protein
MLDQEASAVVAGRFGFGTPYLSEVGRVRLLLVLPLPWPAEVAYAKPGGIGGGCWALRFRYPLPKRSWSGIVKTGVAVALAGGGSSCSTRRHHQRW